MMEQQLIGTATVDSNGNWSMTANNSISRWKACNNSNTNRCSRKCKCSIKYSKLNNRYASAPVITSPADETVTNNNKPTISGTGRSRRYSNCI